MFRHDEPGERVNIILLWLTVFFGSYFVITCSQEAEARPKNYKLLEAERMDVEYLKLRPENRDVYAPDYTGQWRERAALKWRISLLHHLYWDNNVHTETVGSGAVKTVGWQWELGLRITPWLDIMHQHHSRHIMDEPPQREFYPNKRMQFPVEDGIGIRIKFITPSD